MAYLCPSKLQTSVRPERGSLSLTESMCRLAQELVMLLVWLSLYIHTCLWMYISFYCLRGTLYLLHKLLIFSLLSVPLAIKLNVAVLLKLPIWILQMMQWIWKGVMSSLNPFLLINEQNMHEYACFQVHHISLPYATSPMNAEMFDPLFCGKLFCFLPAVWLSVRYVTKTWWQSPVAVY